MRINICFYELLRFQLGEDPDKISSAETDDKIGKEIEKQKEYKNETLTKTMESALREAIKNNNVPTEKVKEVLGYWGYEKLSEIKVIELMEFKKELGIKE